MAFSKRYTVLNFYIRGSSQIPQSNHGISNLWKKFFSKELCEQADELFNNWAFKAETEEAMEQLFTELDAIKHLPSAKFNEPGLRGAGTVVTFVADERIISGINFARNNRLTPYNVEAELAGKEIDHVNPDESKFVLTDEEVFVVSKVAFMPLAS